MRAEEGGCDLDTAGHPAFLMEHLDQPRQSVDTAAGLAQSLRHTHARARAHTHGKCIHTHKHKYTHPRINTNDAFIHESESSRQLD